MKSTCLRSGVAPIEFVMVLPLILFLASGLFLMSRATIAKEAAATQARHDAWKKRASASPGDILKYKHEPRDSQVNSTKNVGVNAGTLFRNTAFQAESRSAVIDIPWHHKTVPFDRLGDFKLHKIPLDFLKKNLTLSAFMTGLSQLMADLLNPGKNPIMIAAAVIGKVLNLAVQVAGKVFMYVIRPIMIGVRIALEIIMIPLRIAAWFSRSARRLLRRIERVIAIINVGEGACINLDRAANGLPVDEPFGIDRLFVP